MFKVANTLTAYSNIWSNMSLTLGLLEQQILEKGAPILVTLNLR
jgi:hypothetical protein